MNGLVRSDTESMPEPASVPFQIKKKEFCGDFFFEKPLELVLEFTTQEFRFKKILSATLFRHPFPFSERRNSAKLGVHINLPLLTGGGKKK